MGQPEDLEAPGVSDAFLPCPPPPQPPATVINRNAFQTTCLCPQKRKSQEGTAFLVNYDQYTIQPVHPKGDQSWVFIGGTDVEAETPSLWPPDVKN